MKKIILILVVSILFGCSSDSKSEDVVINFENIIGKWYVKDIIRPDGSIQPYTNLCSTKRDYFEVFPSSNITFYSQGPSCITYNPYYCDGLVLDNDGVMSQCGSDRFEGTITKLTNKLMRFEYDEPITLNENAPNDGLIKGHIYTKE